MKAYRKNFASRNTCNKAIELGFDLETQAAWFDNPDNFYYGPVLRGGELNIGKLHRTEAILYQQLQRWLREVHNIFVSIDYCREDDNYFWFLDIPNDRIVPNPKTKFKTYEEALEAGLLEALKLIK